MLKRKSGKDSLVVVNLISVREVRHYGVGRNLKLVPFSYEVAAYAAMTRLYACWKGRDVWDIPDARRVPVITA